MIRLFPEMAKAPESLEYGSPKEIVPVNGLPSLHEAEIVAT